MSEAYVLTLAQDALTVAMVLAAPILLVSLIVGVLVSIFQAATQINEVTLTFVPKLIGVILVILILGAWMSQTIIAFAVNLFSSLPNLVP
jgi:flagellar biosynthetic protein FliQ